MNLYRFYFTAEHGAEHECELYARSFDHARELFQEDFGNLNPRLLRLRNRFVRS